jgi:hypothetical protein
MPASHIRQLYTNGGSCDDSGGLSRTAIRALAAPGPGSDPTATMIAKGEEGYGDH